MKRVAKISILALVLVFFILSAAGFLILKTDYWKNLFMNYINRQLSLRTDLRVIGEGLSGNLLYRLRYEKLRIVNKHDYEICELSGVRLSYSWRDLFQAKHTLRHLRIDSLDCAYPASFDSLIAALPARADTVPPALKIFLPTIDLRSLRIGDSRRSGQNLVAGGFLRGSLAMSGDTLTVGLDSAGFEVKAIGERLTFKETALELRRDTLEIARCTLRNKSTTLNLAGSILMQTPVRTRVRVAVDRINLSERLPQIDGIFQTDDYLDLRGQITTIGTEINFDGEFGGRLRNRQVTDGQITAGIKKNQITVSSLSFLTGEEQISGAISGNLLKGITVNLRFAGLDSYDWGLTPVHTELHGGVVLRTIGPVIQPDTIYARVELTESQVAPLRFNGIAGEVIYTGGFVAILDTFYLQLGETMLKVEGEADLNDRTVDARAYFRAIQGDLIASFIKADTLVGTIDGFIEATGSLAAPDLRGWFRGNRFGLPNLNFTESIARFGFVNIQEKKFGDIFIEASDGRTPLIPEPIPLTSLIVRFEGDTTYVQLLKAVGENLDVEVRGNVIALTDFNLQDIKISRSGNILHNLDPIHFSWKRDTLSLEKVHFRLNDGSLIVSGCAIHNNLQSAQILFSNLSVDPLNAFLKGRQGVGGILGGKLEYWQKDNRPYFQGDLNLTDARLLGQRFKEISLTGKVSDKLFSVENFLVRDNEQGIMTGQGFFTCQIKPGSAQPFVTPTDTVSLQLAFNNFDFKTFRRYLLPDLAKDGDLNGTLAVYHWLGSPRLSYDFTLANPVFDRISGKEARVKGGYQDGKLQFTELLLTDALGTTRGRGYLPLNLCFAPLKAEFGWDEPLNMNFSSHTTSLEFLSLYLDDVESIRGSFDLALAISGTPRRPIRTGNFNVKDGIIIVNELENPITGVTGSAVMKDNLMEIVNLTGYMHRPQSQARVSRWRDRLKAMTWDVIFPPKIPEDQPNLNITGRIGFQRFFRPDFDVKVLGEEIYVRTLLAEQEGVIDAVLTVAGSDTLLINGEVDIGDLIIRNEFTSEEAIAPAPSAPSSIFTSTNIHTIIPGSLYFQNSQLDAELEGEMWISQSGDEPYRFAGTLDIRSGKFFYYGWEFDIQRGSIIFDPIEFNPTLDIEAQVDLASYSMGDTTTGKTSPSELATVRLTGNLDNPLLEFESTNYSQSDIIMFLTRTQNIGSQAFTQERLSSDALNMFGMYFERQLEKSISRISGLDEFELRTRGNLFANQQPDQWSIVLGRKIARNLYFKYERTFSLIEPNQLFGLEYRLNRNISIAGDVDQEGLLRINYRYKYRY